MIQQTDFVQEVQKYFNVRPMTLTKLAAELGVSPETVSKWIRRESKPSVAAMQRAISRCPHIFVPQPVKKQIVNFIGIVRDKSASMGGITNSTLQAMNRTLADIKANALKTGQDTYVSVIDFGSSVNPVCDRVNVHSMAPESSYRADLGSTALYDATGHMIQRLENLVHPTGADVSYLLIVLTDGEENQSRVYDANRLQDYIRRVQATDKWTVTFQVPNRRAKDDLCHRLGIPEGNVAVWDATSDKGAVDAGVMRSSGLSTYYSARSAGQTKTTAFYTTDASKITTKDLQKGLADISTLCKVWTVDKEEIIRTFVETKLKGPMLKGAAFYQLMKTEKKVQDYKQLLIMDKTTKHVYYGQAARQLLGLPASGTIKVAPGNHSNYEIFVQSTSVNRKLPRGTKVVYYSAVGTPFTEGPSARTY